MRTDIFGTQVSLNSQEVCDAWDKMQLGFLAHAAITPTHLAEVLEKQPNFALGHAVKGLFYLMLGRRELFSISMEAYAAAQKAMIVETPTQRERLFVKALGLWLQGAPKSALQKIEAVLLDSPADALAMKVSQAIHFILGDSPGMRQSMERIMPAYGEDHAAYGYMLGCHAFSLEETGDYAHAEQTGIKALSYARNDAWGLHAVAHVYDMTANSKQGLIWLEEQKNGWTHCNNFGYHVWWHKALMHLDQGDVAQVFDLYDREIRKDHTDDYRDISNATSLLSRLELDGHDVGNRWEELADLSSKRTEDGCLIFADLHYILALVGGKRETALSSIVSRISRDAEVLQTEAAKAMAKPGVSAAQGLEAFGDGNYEQAFVNLAQSRASMQQAGGSHAQRDVFERLTIDAGLRAGFLDQTEAILKERQSLRGGAEDRYAAVRYEMIAAARAKNGVDAIVAAE